MATVTETVILKTGTSWTVPFTWNSASNSIVCIGGGAGGGGNGGSGGGGGARVINTNVSLTAGASISYTIGAGGSNAAGGDTTFNSSAMVAKGGTVGTGGQAAASTGSTKYSGGNGGTTGGGGGGAAGNAGNGSNGVSNYGDGGAGGATDGGNGGTGGGTLSINGTDGYLGYENGNLSAALGSNYAGGGGGGGGFVSDKFGDTYYTGGNGALFGGGAGAGGTTLGAQGAIIIQWTWNSTLQSSGAISISNVNTILRDSSTDTTSLNDADARSVAGVSSGQISMSNFYNGYEGLSLIGSTAWNATSSLSQSIALPSGYAAGDLAIFSAIGLGATYPTVDVPGWTYMGSNSRSIYSTYGYYTGAFYRILQASDVALYATCGTASGFGGQLLVFRGASKANAIQKKDATTGTSLDFTGITKSAGSKALLSFVFDRDGSVSNPTQPSGWTAALRNTPAVSAIESAYIDSRSYTNSSTITWSNFSQVAFAQQGILIEIE